jgi:hypothetical protein
VPVLVRSTETRVDALCTHASDLVVTGVCTMQMFALLAALKAGERHADLRDSRTFECLYAVAETASSGLAESFAIGIPHADLRDNNVEYL